MTTKFMVRDGDLVALPSQGRRMTVEMLTEWFRSKGWSMKPNTTSFYSPKYPDVRYRLKKHVIRKERRTSWGEWAKVSGGYISALSIDAEGRLVGLAVHVG